MDHVVPRNRGGSNDLSNLQALCYTCNAQKRDQDDTRFRDVIDSYGARESGCPFSSLESDRIVGENELPIAFLDNYPVTPDHTLVIPKRHIANYFDLCQPEHNAINDLLHQRRTELLDQEHQIARFNVGVNAGEAAGQTIFHTHVHLIPRRHGDTQHPRGGVRGVIKSKQSY